MKLWTSEFKGNPNPTDTNLLFQKTAPKVFNVIDVIIIGVGSSLAVGSSVLIGEITKCVAGPAVVVSIFLAGITAFFGGLCLAEFGVQFHKVDSAYHYSYCWGRSAESFMFGWVLTLQHVAGTASAAKGVISFTDALTDNKISDLLKNSTTTPFPDVFPYFDYFSLVIVLLITIFISFGLKDSEIIKKLFTVCSIVLFIAVIVAGALKADIKNWDNEESFARTNGFAPFGGFGVVKAAAIAVYGFIGFDSATCAGNEIKKKKINLPLAFLAIILITLGIFSGIGVVLTLMLPYTQLSFYAAVPFAFQHLELFAMKWVAVVATYFTFITSFFGIVFPLPRIILTMANDGLLFHCLGNNHQRFKAPVLAIAIGGLLSAVVAGIFTFQTLVNVAVIAALSVYTILAFNVILIRYFPRFKDNEKEFWKSLVCNNAEVSLKGILKNYFNFKEKQPTNLTKAIITGNLVLFCICSIGLGIIFNFFYDFLVRCAAEAVVSASIFLCVMFFIIISMCCQPKSQENMPFKVPLFPFIPCFSIFLNFFLMTTFDSITWILFSSWMIMGVLPFFLWHFWKIHKGELGEISLYEINSTNAMKLNKSIWKIKSDKKSFYEGAVNPAFTYDFDDYPDDEKNANVEVKKKISSLDEAIQRAESVVDKKPEHLNHELQLNFISEGIDNNLGDESEKVQWECVAEIHTEEEFSPESVALEIVDNTYNFLSEESEETFKDDVNENLIISKEKSVGDGGKKSSEFLQVSETNNEHSESKNKIDILKEKISETEINSNNNEQNESIINRNSEKNLSTFLQENKKNEDQNDTLFFKSPDSDQNPFYDENQNGEKLVYLIVETFYEAHQSEMISQQNNATAISNTEGKPVLDEQNKIKDFKEKLNQLLKNQINNAVVYSKDSSLSKSDDSNSEINKDVIHNSFKTLNKSQIKDKLELLLAKKPSQRPSLKSSFNINLKQTENENAEQKTNEETKNSYILNGSEKEERYVKSLPVLADSIKEKILSLKNVDHESSDICC